LNTEVLQGTVSTRLRYDGIFIYLSKLSKHPLTQSEKHIGRGLFLDGQPRSHSRRWGSNAFQFWEFLAIYAYARCRGST